MAYFKLALNPGIDKQNTEYGAEGGWTNGDNVRFRFGLPEKIGGWTNFNNAASYLVGFASETFSWNNTAGSPYLAVGTNRKIYVSTGGAWHDHAFTSNHGSGGCYLRGYDRLHFTYCDRHGPRG